jgi:hypothetical protein
LSSRSQFAWRRTSSAASASPTRTHSCLRATHTQRTMASQLPLQTMKRCEASDGVLPGVPR